MQRLNQHMVQCKCTVWFYANPFFMKPYASVSLEKVKFVKDRVKEFPGS